MSNIIKLIENNLILLLLVSMLIGFFIEPIISYSLKSFFYAISLGFRSILSFCVPIIVFIIALNSMIGVGKNAILIIFLLIPFLFFVNSLEIFYSLLCSDFLLGNFIDINTTKSTISINNLEPMFVFTWSNPIKTKHSLILAFVIGVFNIIKNVFFY